MLGRYSKQGAALFVLSALFCGFLLFGIFVFAPFLLPPKMAVDVLKLRMGWSPPYYLVLDEDMGVALAVPYDREINWRKSPWSLRHIPFPGQRRIGYRGNPGEVSQPVDIAVLGDSHGYGLEVAQDETLVSELGRLSGLRTANLALPYQGTTQEVKLYELYGHRLRPKVVLLMICPNDPWDNERFRTWRRRSRGSRSRRDEGIDFFEFKSQGATPEIGAYHRFINRILPYVPSKRLRSVLRQGLLANRYDEETAAALKAPEGLKTLEEDVLALQALARGEGARFGVVLTHIWGERIFDGGLPRMKEILIKHHIPFLDLEPVFGGDCSARRGLCLPRERRHWNKKGHAVAAAEILGFLRRERLVSLKPQSAR